MAAKKTIDPLFAAYTRTAPRLDLEFLVSHTRIVPMPLSMLQACAAAHAAMVRDEPTGRNHGKHMAAVRALGDQYRAYRCQKDGAAAYHRSPWPTTADWETFQAIDDPDLAFDLACIESGELAYAYAERQGIADAGFAYATACRDGKYGWICRNEVAA